MQKQYKSTLYICYLSYITQAIVVNFAPILFVIFQTDFHISFEMLGRLVLINFGIQLLVDLLAIKFVDAFGYRVAALTAHTFCTAGLILLGFLPKILPDPYIGIVLSVMVYAIGGGLTEVIISPIVDAVPSDAKGAGMSLLHSFYCWGQLLVVLVTTVLLRVIGNVNWSYIAFLWAVVPVICFIGFAKVPLPPMTEAHEKTPLKVLFGSKFFLCALLLMACAGASEQAMAQWSSLFAEKGLGVPKMLGDLLGPCLFALFMGIGRTAYGIWGQRYNIRRLLLLCSGLCILCYTVTALSGNPVIALLSCSLTGLTVSLMWPGVLSLSAASFPKGGTAMFGFLALFGDVGCSVGPWLAGIVSDAVAKAGSLTMFAELTAEQVGLKMGILSAVIFPVLMAIGIFALRKVE